jgi:UDP-glucose:(heptosyl)LPS alpha-1,3-glucosyltransferase
MTTVVQICPEIGPGSGVAGVAYNLEREWQREGVETRRFTMTEARGSWLPKPGPGVRGRFVLIARVLWFSTVGTLLARRYLRRHPEFLSICHNDALAGDVYVNHGIVQTAMKARGAYFWRMLRNPLHAFTAVRDTLRYTTRLHRLVVNLVTDEEQALRSVYPHLRPPTVVIGNGVDVERFQPPTDDERHSARAQLGLAPDDFAVAFVGHEYDRKGLPRVIEALAGTPDSIRLVVAGGTPDMVARLHTEAADHGLAGRVIALGAVTDPRPVFHASDVFCLPSAYESFGLVYLEALACGLPVVASRTGCVPDVIVNGSNGFVTSREPDAIREALMAIRGADRAAMAVAAREAAMEHSWEQVARGYLQVLTRQPFPSIRERHR